MNHLRAITELFAALDRHAIRYCHWKSNQHLDEALAGKTDLDVLVDGAQAAACRQVLHMTGCKQVLAQPSARYPGIEDWLVFDSETGRLGHIHLHFRIMTGSKPKQYHVPVEQWLLSQRESLFNVAIPAHAHELIMLIVRIALKARYRDLSKALLRPACGVLSAAVKAELDWLLARIDPDDISPQLQDSGLPLDASALLGFLQRYSAGRITPAYLLGFKIQLSRSLKNCRTASGSTFFCRRAGSGLKGLCVYTPKKKTLQDRGLFFALVGADGSGKTTLVRDLAAWLGWKLETNVLYFGIPKSAGLYGFFTNARQRADMFTTQCLRRRIKPAANLSEVCSRTLNALLWVYVAWYRFEMSRRAQAFRKKGIVVIGERFPLRHFNAMEEPMDGARLQKNPRGILLGRLERFFYSSIILPDRLIVLQAGADVLNARKPNAFPQRLREKADAVNSIRADAHTVTVDAEASYASVTLAVKTAVWKML